MKTEDLQVGKTYYAAISKWPGRVRVRGLTYVGEISEETYPIARFIFCCLISNEEEAYDMWQIDGSFYSNELEAISEHQRDLMSALISCQARAREIEKELMQRVEGMEKGNEGI